MDKEDVNNEFHLVYQPQINSTNDTLVGVEALIRWSSHNLGVVSPGEFIPLVESNNVIEKVTRWVIDESLQTIRYWLDQNFVFNQLSVNITVNNLRAKDFRSWLLDLCDQYSVEPRYLGLEISERQPLYLNNHVKQVIKDLMNDGFQILLDDFGSGFSNFDILDEFAIHTIKLDKVFIDNIGLNQFQLIVEGILGIAQSKDVNIIAEGVESRDQLDILSKIGLHHIQGYYYSKPISKEAIMTFRI